MEFNYLDLELMENMCHRLAVALFDTTGDPIAPFEDHDSSLLESALNLPRQTFGGQDLYPTLIEKAATLYYSLNKNHTFKNGNKRISTSSLLVFLYINGYWLDTGKDEMVNKALYVAESNPHDREKVVENIKQWIKDHLVIA